MGGGNKVDRARDAKCQNVFVMIAALPRWLETPGPVACTLLGAIESTKTACPTPGAWTLVAALPGSRPTAVMVIPPMSTSLPV